MRSSTLPVSLAFALVSLTAVGCAGEDEQPTYIVLSTDPTCGADAGAGKASGSGGSSGSTAPALGPQCKAYIACCAELADVSPALGSSCSSLEETISEAQDKGVSVSSYESACKSGLSAAQSAGYCE